MSSKENISCVYDPLDLSSFVLQTTKLDDCPHVTVCKFHKYQVSVHIMVDAPCHDKACSHVCNKTLNEYWIRVVARASHSPDSKPRILSVEFVSDDLSALAFVDSDGNRSKVSTTGEITMRPYKSGRTLPTIRHIEFRRFSRRQLLRVPVHVNCQASRGLPGNRPLSELRGLSVAIPPKHLDVFLCYNRDDILLAKQVRQLLEANHLVVWIDESVQPGSFWEQDINNAIERATCTAVLIGPHGFSAWMKKETNLSIARAGNLREFPIIPVLLPGSDVKMIPQSLVARKWVDLREGIDSESISRLLAGIRNPQTEF